MKKISLDNAVRTLTTAIDLVGISEIHHGKRVAAMAVKLAEQLRWSAADRLLLFRAAMLHDCGVSRSDEHLELVTQFEWGRAQEHCARGARYLANVEALSELAPVLLWHHTHFVDIPATVPDWVRDQANLIYLADRIDALRAQHDVVNHPERVSEVMPIIAAQSRDMFRPEFVDAAHRATESEAFWFDLEDDVIEEVLDAVDLPHENRGLEWTEIRQLSRLFAQIIDAKSPFTANHSVGVAAVAYQLAKSLGYPDEHCRKIELAGLLHDIGKLRIPDAILEKTGPLDASERRLMVRHSYETMMLLQHLFGPHPIANWAAWHHETPAGTGYPFHITADQLPQEARIIAVADIFQALLQERPYRGGMTPDDAIKIMENLAEHDALDKTALNTLKDNINICVLAARDALDC